MNAARDLAATGTPGEALRGRDAIKIARAVNALGPLGDLLDVVAHHRPTVTSGEVDFSITEGPNVVNQRDFCACGVEWPCALTRTAAAVEASLRGEATA